MVLSLVDHSVYNICIYILHVLNINFKNLQIKNKEIKRIKENENKRYRSHRARRIVHSLHFDFVSTVIVEWRITKMGLRFLYQRLE